MRVFITTKYPLESRDNLPYQHPETPTGMRAWMTVPEITKLMELANKKVYCEIGSYEGFSSFMIAKVAHKMLLIDPSFDDPIYNFLRKNVVFPFRKKIVMVRDCSENIIPYLQNNLFDVLFIDGDHDYRHVSQDYLLWRRTVRKGGIIAFHDYNETFSDVVAFIDENVFDTFLGTCQSLIWFEKKD